MAAGVAPTAVQLQAELRDNLRALEHIRAQLDYARERGEYLRIAEIWERFDELLDARLSLRARL